MIVSRNQGFLLFPAPTLDASLRGQRLFAARAFLRKNELKWPPTEGVTGRYCSGVMLGYPALKFVREQMKPADVVAIMSASTGPVKIIQDFTTDKDRLEEVIKGFQIGAASELAGVAGNGGDDTSGADTGAAFNADETEFNIFNTDKQLATLGTASKMLAAFPEKKALLYFSSGISSG